jgi:hypothetical protein
MIIMMGESLTPFPFERALVRRPSTLPHGFNASAMNPCPITPVSVPLFRAPVWRPSTPPRLPASVLPVCVQRTPLRTFISRGQSPTPFQDLLPPNLASFLCDTQMGTRLAPFCMSPSLSALSAPSYHFAPFCSAKCSIVCPTRPTHPIYLVCPACSASRPHRM